MSGKTTPEKAVRPGRPIKRTAILTAARELFVRDGVERTSMDAVAARAGVSKRTVYDYYGDKRRLLLGVVEEAGESALRTLREVADAHLARVAASVDASGVEAALVEFADALGAALFSSIDYVAAARLIAENEGMLPEIDGHPLDIAYAHALGDALSLFAQRGLLEVDDPALAAHHFQALTTMRVLQAPSAQRADAAAVRHIMVDGARVFLRACVPR